MKKYIILVTTVSIIFITFSLYAAERIVDYGFEDWGGDIDDTPGYIVCTSYKTEHEESSEVITSYNANEMSQTWTPHSGNYYFLQNGASASYPLAPDINGITEGSVYSRMNVGTSESFCPKAYNFPTDITTGEIFIRVWFRFNKGFGNIGGNMKLLRIYSNTGSANDTVYMHLSTTSISPSMLFACSGEPGIWIGSNFTATNAYDGNWHKFSFYVNWNTGVILGWYDIDVEKPENAVKSYVAGDGQLGNGIGPYYVVIKSNYSGTYPTEETYYGMDDIEIWDGLPIPPDAPKNLRLVE